MKIYLINRNYGGGYAKVMHQDNFFVIDKLIVHNTYHNVRAFSTHVR